MTIYKGIDRGASIVINEWIKIKRKDRLIIVTNDVHMKEIKSLRKFAEKKHAHVDVMIVEKKGLKIGVFFDEHEDVFDDYTIVIGAADYSIITTKAAKRAIKRKINFLSLPLSTNDGRSMLSYEFMTMDTKKSKLMAKIIMKYIESSSVIHVTTDAGTDLKFYKRKRTPGFFNGVVKDGKGFSSASIELYIPIEEDMTEGTMILDGSFGYIGKIEKPVAITFKDGYIKEIEDSKDGEKLKNYILEYHDEKMFSASELGIGLNSYSECLGRCYIEDESAYGTFHIGFGRNIALGGLQEANGHFDLVAFKPDIYADNRKIMEKGKIIIPEPEIY